MSVAPASFYVTGGSLRHDTPSYVERQADADLYATLQQGEFCYILTSRQMGKSSLMNRTAARLRAEGVAVATLDLTAIGQNLSPEQWYDGLLLQLGRKLDMEDELEEFWEEHAELGPLQRWMTALHDVVLPQLSVERSALSVENPNQTPQASSLNAQRSPRVVIFVDEIDVVRSLRFSADEFFAAIRECYTRRAEAPEYNRLTFCLLGVASPSDLIQDTRITPFNIGRRIELTDFSAAEATPLAQGLGGDARNGKALLDRVLFWTSGHPYLTQRLCRAVAEQASIPTPNPQPLTPKVVDRLCAALFLSASARETDDNLSFVRDRLLRSEADLASLLDLYGKVRAGTTVRLDDTNPLTDLLRLSGAVRLAGSRLAVRNRIYERVFDRGWVAEHMPDAEVRRQKAAFRRGVWRASAIAGVAMAVMLGLTTWALRSEASAVDASRRAEISEHSAQAALQETKKQRVRADGEAARATTEARRADQKAEVARVAQGKAEDAQQQAEQRRVEAEQQRHRAQEQQRRAESQERVAVREKGRAQSLAQKERAARLKGARLLYDADVQLAAQEWESESGTAQQVSTLLADHEQDQDVRSFEWRYQWNLLHNSAVPFRIPATLGAMAFAPDGSLLTTTGDGQLRRWDARTRRPAQTIDLGEKNLSRVTLASDGRTAAVGADDGTVKLLDAATGRETGVLQGHRARITMARFLPDNRTLLTMDGTRMVKVWDTITRQEKETVTSAHPRFGAGDALSPDGKLMAVPNLPGNGVVALIDWRKGSASDGLLSALPGSGSTVGGIAFSPDGRLLATGSPGGGLLILWDIAARKEKRRFNTHSAGIFRITFSPDGATLATGVGDGSVKLWDVADGHEQCSFKGHTAPISWLLFSPNGKRLASGSGDGTARLWDLLPPQGTHSSTEAAASISCLAASPDNRLLATGGWDGKTSLWDARTGRLLSVLPESGGRGVSAVAFSPDGHLLATGGTDSWVQLWDPATRRKLRDLKGRPMFSPVKDRDPSPSEISQLLAQTVGSLAFSPDGAILVAGFGSAQWHGDAGNQVVKLWDVKSGREIHAPLADHAAAIPSLAFSLDGAILATASHDRTVKLWNTRTWQEIRTLSGPDEFDSVTFSRDGHRLASGSFDGTIRLWDVATGREERALKGHSSYVASLAFSPDGRTLASGSMDETVRLWDPVGGRETRTLLGHPDGVTCAAFSPGGNALATGSFDGTVRLWEAAPAREITAAIAEERAIQQEQQARAALRGVASSNGQVVRLQWRPVPDAIGYQLYRGPGQETSGAQPAQPVKLTARPVTGTAFTDLGPGLVPGEPLTYAIAPLYREGGKLREGAPVTRQVTPVAAPPGWQGSSLNEADRSGSVRLDAATGEITLRGSGADFWNEADGGYFFNRPEPGDFRITVTLRSVPAATDGWAKAGLMIRESLDPQARTTYLVGTPSHGLDFQWRGASDRPTATAFQNGRAAVIAPEALHLPITLRLTRRGNRIRAEYSLDSGRSFQQAGAPLTFAQPLPTTLYAGLAITARDENKTSEAQFQDLKIEPLRH